MKRLIALSLITTMSLTTLAFANEISLPVPTLYGNSASVTPQTPLIIIDRQTLEELVPAREYAEGIGYTVKWDELSKTITFTKGENTFIATVDSNKYYCDIYAHDPETIELNSKTSIIEGKSYIPKAFAKRLFDIPVVEPMPVIPPQRPTTPITPQVPVTQPERPAIPVTPELPVIDPTVTTIDKMVDPKLDTEVAKIIAETVDNTMYELEQEQLKANEEYKEAFLATGGTIDNYIEPQYEIDYELLSSNHNYTSVKVYRYQSLASSYTKEIYYTFDSKTGEQKSLEFFLGKDYAEIVKNIVVDSANQRMKDFPETYSYDQDALNNLVIDENTAFYLDQGSNIFVVFPKYTISAGAYGPQEFNIKVIKIFN